MRRRRVVIVLVVVLAVLGYFPLRSTVFAPRFDVPSIAATPHYQEPPLLDRAWALPVAATFGRRVVSQTNGSVCGPASIANILRSLGVVEASQARVIDDSGYCWTGLCIPGLTLDELGSVASLAALREGDRARARARARARSRRDTRAVQTRYMVASLPRR